MEASDQNEEIICKIAVVGSASVGKTSLIRCFCFQEDENVLSSTSVKYTETIVHVVQQRVRLRIWDSIYGDEVLRSCPFDFDALLCVYDVANFLSLVELKEWLDMFRSSINSTNFCTMLVENKIDKGENTFQSRPADALNEALFRRISAKYNIGVQEAFHILVRKILAEQCIRNVSRNIPDQNLTLKIVVLGDSGVGKSCVLHRYFRNEFIILPITIGMDHVVKIAHIANQRVKIQFWDTAGEERFAAISRSYYRNAHGIILMYDVNKLHTFERLLFWLNKFKQNLTFNNVVKMIIGNKVDVNERQVPLNRLIAFAHDHEALHWEVSAKEDSGVDEAFANFVFEILATPSVWSSNNEEKKNKISLTKSSAPLSLPKKKSCFSCQS